MPYSRSTRGSLAPRNLAFKTPTAAVIAPVTFSCSESPLNLASSLRSKSYASFHDLIVRSGVALGGVSAGLGTGACNGALALVFDDGRS